MIEKKTNSETKIDFHKLVQYRNERNPFSVDAGVEIIEIKEGYAKAVLRGDERKVNPIGSVHGGCLFTLADTTAGSAATSHGVWMTTLDADIHFMRPALHQKTLYAEANEIKRGANISVKGLDVAVANRTRAFQHRIRCRDHHLPGFIDSDIIQQRRKIFPRII